MQLVSNGIVLIAIFLIGIDAKALYSIVAPGTLRSEYDYNVSVTIHEAYEVCQVNVSIESGRFVLFQVVDVKPKTTVNAHFKMPKLDPAVYHLSVQGVSGIDFKNKTRLKFNKKLYSIFIQTDKAVYKPGDLIQFRVMILDERTRPAKVSEPITIEIKDHGENLLKQWKNLTLVKGIYSGQYQLADQPVLGKWRLSVEIGAYDSHESMTFSVEKYILPKFEVRIETNKDIARPDGEIHGVISASYTYGKKVKGQLTLTVKPAYFDEKQSSEDDASNSFRSQKMLEINGKTQFSFDLERDIHLDSDMLLTPSLEICAIVEEEVTGNKINTTVVVHLHRERYTIASIERPETFHPLKSVEYKVAVKNVDGSPVLDQRNQVSLFVGFPEDDSDDSLHFEARLDEYGIATFRISLSSPRYNHYSIICEYRGVKQRFPGISRYRSSALSNTAFKLILKTRRPRLNSQVTFEVQANHFIPHLVYTIVARGNIVRSAYVEVPPNQKTHTFGFDSSVEMIPHANLFVHYTAGSDLRFEEMSLAFEEGFENQITIKAPVKTKPGKNIKIQVETAMSSYIGLMAVDQSVLLMKSGNDFSKKNIFDKLNKTTTKTPEQGGIGRYPGKQSGLVTLTNADYPYEYPTMDDSNEIIENDILRKVFRKPVKDAWAYSDDRDGWSATQGLHVRKSFPETWFFLDVENADSSYTFSKQVPDTMTSWIISGFSLNSNLGLALTENPTKLQVFQPFFVTTNLPYSVIRGEVITIPVIVFNYLDQRVEAEVTLDNTDGEFDFIQPVNASENSKNRIQHVDVPSNEAKQVQFVIRPKIIGSVTLKITAITPIAGDSVHKILRVEAEGITKYVNKMVPVKLKRSASFSENIMIDIPDDKVPGSEHIEFAAAADALAPTLKNLGQLVRMPHGCGEQNMVNFVPNILVLKYLHATATRNELLEERARRFLEVGYQRELTYKHDDGSFSAFGSEDVFGSTWLTAYVMRSFLEAKGLIYIDSDVIKAGLYYLQQKQTPDGSFIELDDPIDFAHQDPLGLAAFVLLAFLEQEFSKIEYEDLVALAVQYLVNSAQNCTNEYSLSIVAYALRRIHNSTSLNILEKLDAHARQESDFKWWSNGDASKDVEITCYVMLTKMDVADATETELLPTIKWIMSKRNSLGGFDCTQSTVLALQVLTEFAEKTGAGEVDISIVFEDVLGVSGKGNLTISSNNRSELPTRVLERSTRQLKVLARGTGSSMLQLSYNYNVVSPGKTPSFNLRPTIKNETSAKMLILEICAEYRPLKMTGEGHKSNMVIMEVALPSGYVANSDSLRRLETEKCIKRIEVQKSESLIQIYFDGFKASEEKCVTLDAIRAFSIAEYKPSLIKIYDYYNPNRYGTAFYQMNSTSCHTYE